MLTAVVDTNVLVSAILSPKGLPAQLVRAFQAGAFQLVLSPSILEEVWRVCFAPEIRPFWRVPEEDVLTLLMDLERSALLVPGTTPVQRLRDPDDAKFLAAAVEAAAPYLVSGDADLRVLQTYQGIKIVSLADFLRILEQSSQ